MALITTNKTKDDFSRQEESEEAAMQDTDLSGCNQKMVTVPQAKAENFLLALTTTMEEVESFKTYVTETLSTRLREMENFENRTVQLFNSLIESTSGLKSKIDVADSYEHYLEERVKNAQLSQEIALLEKQLQKEKAEITVFIQTVSSTVETKLTDMQLKVNELKSADVVIEESIGRFKSETDESIMKYQSDAESKLEEIGNHLLTSAVNQYTILKNQCDEMIKKYTEKCQGNLDIVKNQSIDFLRQCSAENKKLIEKVPSVSAGKYSKKDIIIYAMAALSIVCSALNTVLQFS